MSKLGMELKMEAKRPTECLKPAHTWELIEQHTRDLNPVDRHEKLERIVYTPDLENRLATPSISETSVLWTPDQSARKFDHGVVATLGKNEKEAQRVPYTLTDQSWRQLCSLISPAANFKGVMDVTPPQLRFGMVNHFLQETTKKRKLDERVMLLRTWEPEFAKYPILRGFLTHKYIKLDDNDIWGALRETPEVKEAVVRHFHVEEGHSTFKMIWPNKVVQLPDYQRKRGDVLNYAVEITNSEIGAGSVSVWGAVEVLSCTNGMTRTDQVCRFVHTGDRETKLRLMGEAIREAAQKTDKLVDDIRASLDVHINDPFGMIENAGANLGWSEDFQKQVQAAWKPETGGTLFDITQAITSAAKTKESGRERFVLERDAGTVLSDGLKPKPRR